MKKLQLFIKRAVDIVFSFTALLLLVPFMVIIAALIKLTSKGTILFVQDRLGKDGKIFKLYKFRTMIPGAVNIGSGLSVGEKDSRITKIGAILRKTSLDELPQLFNVLKGDISLVGPRPAVPEHLDYYGDSERRRLKMKPGITGLAMVKGRASIPWSKRIECDIEYVNKFNLWLDLVIILKTAWVVLTRKNTYYDHDKFGPAFDLKKKANK